MTLPVLQIASLAPIAPIAIYFGYLRAKMHRRNRQSWESLIARLRPDWGGRELSDHFLWKEGLTASPDEIWEHMHGTRGLWTIFKNAGVMQEMAEFAVRNNPSIDPALIETLRNDAAQIRICAIKTISECAFSQASESIRIHAFHAASMYTGMTARMAQLIQDNADMAMPDFVAAM
jgi:hypothetical protein